MAGRRIYLDYNATAPARIEALDAFACAAGEAGNASSVHAEGRAARAQIETARRRLAELVGAESVAVTFTSGGTEAANLALAPTTLADGTRVERLLVGATEHPAVLNGHRFDTDAVTILPVGRDGRIDMQALSAALQAGGPAMVAAQAANNETGVIQPVAEIAMMTHAAGGILVCDAVQAAGRVDCRSLGADIVLLSAHKLGGLPGAGAAVTRSAGFGLVPLLRGGPQERGLRAGTENVPALAAFGAAAALADRPEERLRLRALRDRFEAGLRHVAPEVEIFGEGVERLPNTSCFSVPGVEAEKLMILLDLGGVAVSSGSACSSGKVGRSHVLEAMGIGPDLRRGAIRVSFGWRSLEADVQDTLGILAQAVRRLSPRVLRSAA